MSVQIQKRSVLTLKDCCFKSLADFVIYSSTERLCFECLPSNLLDELLTSLGEQGVLENNLQLADLVLNRNCIKLDLRYFRAAVTKSPELFTTLSNLNLEHLTELNIQGFHNKFKENIFFTPILQYVNLIRNIPNIRKLIMDSTGVTDFILGHLGENCPKLEHLSLENCKITDVGVFSLCITMTDLEDSRPRELRLKYFNVMHTDVTVKGALLALQTLPYLENLVYQMSFGVFKQYPAAIEELEFFSLLKIRSLCAQANSFLGDTPHLVANTLTKDTVTCAAKYCPNVKHITLRLDLLEDDSLDCLVQFDKLESVTLTSDQRPELWQPNFYSFFKFRGNSLSKLELGPVTPCDVGLIAYFCTGLEYLKLETVQYYSGHPELINPRAFRNLRKLYIYEDCYVEKGPSSRDLVTLLSTSRQLEAVNFWGLCALTDNLFSLILQQNTFVNLRRAIFCPVEDSLGRYVESVELLLKTATNLQECRIHLNGNLFSFYAERIENLVQREGYSYDVFKLEEF